jgi:hypothetical protein
VIGGRLRFDPQLLVFPTADEEPSGLESTVGPLDLDLVRTGVEGDRRAQRLAAHDVAVDLDDGLGAGVNRRVPELVRAFSEDPPGLRPDSLHRIRFSGLPMGCAHARAGA